MNVRSISRTVVVGMFVGAVGLGVGAAVASGDDDVINGCYNKTNGNLRVVGEGADLPHERDAHLVERAGTRRVSPVRRAPSDPMGPAGPQGEPGPAGPRRSPVPQGDPVPAGPQGPAGAGVKTISGIVNIDGNANPVTQTGSPRSASGRVSTRSPSRRAPGSRSRS
jgi:hypothetical protein